MNQVLKLAEKLISISSVSHNPKALEETLDICKKELLGFNFKEFEKNNIKSLLFYNTATLPEKFKLILNGHLDIVEGKGNQFKPSKENNKLYGRGAYDMKTAAAAMVLLFKELANKVSYPLGLQLVTDEEVGGFNGTKYQVEQGIRADFIIAGENTDLKINHRSKGIIWLKITTKGKSAHGAYPWLGENAIWKMQKILSKLEQIYPIPQKEEWCTTANLAMINTSNKTYNKVPDECSVSLDIRFIPEDKEKVIENIKKIVGEEIEIEVIVKEPEHSTDENNQYIKQLVDAVMKTTGKDTELVYKHGASDIRHYNLVGCDGITFGPIGEGHHSDKEWVDIKSAEDYYNILKEYLSNLN